MSSADMPLFPLPTVLFPGAYLPLRIFEQRYIDLVRECSATGGCFGVCLASEPQEPGQAASHLRVGTAAEICDFFTLEDGLLGITARGMHRFSVRSTHVRDNGLVMAEVEKLAEGGPVALPEQFSVLSVIAARFMEQLGGNYPGFQPADLQDALWVGYRLSELLPLENLEKQALLEIVEPLERLQALLEVLPRFQEPASA